MRTLYTFDKHNYSDDMEVFERFAVRAVIIRDGKLAMQQAGEGYYKICLLYTSPSPRDA